MIQKIDNQQGYNLSNNQLQALVSGFFGDGCFIYSSNNTMNYSTNCIHKEYIDYKSSLLEDLVLNVKSSINQGYKQNIIYTCMAKASKDINNIYKLSIEDKLSLLDNLGLALWFYDDGSLHKSNHFFNLNTHSFSEEIHNDLFIPYFKNLGMLPKVFKDRKKDGREFCYLYFGKHFGAYEIMNILKQYPISCYSYKLWSSETIQKWSKLKAQLKSENKVISPRKFENIILGISTL